MAALPTDFSVTSALGKPTPSPSWPIDGPAISDPVDAPLFDGAGLVASVSVPVFDLAAPYTPESIAVIDTPSEATPEAEPTISTPSSASAESEPVISAPSAAASESEPTIDLPSSVAAQSEPTISVPSAATSQGAPTISAPSSATAESSAVIDTPSAATAQTEPAISVPTIMTASTGTATTPPFPLNHARILYDNLLLNYDSVSVTTGTNGAYALVPNTYKKWTFTGGAEITITLPANVDIDTICVGAHTLGTSLFSVGAEWSGATTGSFTPLTTGKNPTDNTPLMFHYTGGTVSARRIKIVCSGTGSVGIGYISAGIALQLQRPFFSGHTPITMGDNTVYRNNMTDGGEFTSRSIIRKGFSNSVTLDNVDRTWIQNYFLDFKEVSKEYLYFIAWNLLEYPKEVGLCETGGDISLQFSGTRDLMSINWSQTGHGSV